MFGSSFTFQTTMVIQFQDSVDIVIYHNPCYDGFGSAFAVWQYFQVNNPSKLDQIEFYGTSHGKAPPDVEGKNVVICDFSYDFETLKNMIEQSNNLIIIDHHKTAEHNLLEINDEYKIFDMNKSGAVLTWEYFFPNKEVPLLLQYIQDRDIWTKKLPNTDAFSSWFYTLPFDFEIFAEYLDDQKLLYNIETIGKAYMQHNEYLIKDSCKHLVPVFSEIKGKLYMILYTNSTVLASDIGNRAFQYYPLADFSVIYSHKNWTDTTAFSLRSTSCHVDVSDVARKFGGGGHRNASGCRIDMVSNVLPSTVISKDFYELIQSISIIELGDFKVCVLNAAANQYKLAKYMMQTKYVDRNNKPVREATFINTYNQLNDSSDDILDKMEQYLNLDGNNIKIDAAVVWWKDSDKVNKVTKLDVATEFIHELEEKIEKIEF